MYAPCIDLMMREVLHTLGDIDYQHEVELTRLEASQIDKLKNDIRRTLVARHRERREPYVELLAQLRQQQHRPALAS